MSKVPPAPFSRRGRVDAAPNAVTRALAGRAPGRGLLDLTRSNPTQASLPYDPAAILGALADPAVLRYDPAPLGLTTAREAVAALWADRGFAVDPARVVLTASTSEAYAFLLKLLCDPGDEVLVPQPSYPLFEHLFRLEGVVPVPYPLAYDGAWHVDLGALSARASPRARAIVLVSPNNPTGSFIATSELEAVGALGLPILSDEVFGQYALREDPRRARSVLAASGGLVFALDGLSKLVGLPQLKLAWITLGGDAAAVGGALEGLELIADTFLSPGAPVQRALPALLSAGAHTRRAISERLGRNLAALRRLAAGTAVTPLDVEGGWTAVVRLPATRPEEDWVLGLLEERDVLVQPGFFYDFFEEPFIVLGLITPEHEFEAGVRRIIEYVQSSV